MKQIIIGIAFVIVACLCITSPSTGAEVAQGKCLEYDSAKKVISLEEYDTKFSKETPYGKPSGTVSKFDCTSAKIGFLPQPGDILRIAYDVQGTTRKALKVMNVSKQDLRKK